MGDGEPRLWSSKTAVSQAPLKQGHGFPFLCASCPQLPSEAAGGATRGLFRMEAGQIVEGAFRGLRLGCTPEVAVLLLVPAGLLWLRAHPP